MAQVKRASKEIVSSLTKDTKAPSHSASEDRLLKLLFKAYPDRLAKRRKEDRERALMVGGHGLRLWSKSRVKKGDYLLAIEIAGGKGESLCRQASLVKREFIPTVKVLKTIFSKLDERVQRVEREMYEDLCLEERVIPLEREEAALTLAHNCAKNIEKLLMRKRETKEFIARVNCLREWLPELALPDFSLPGLQGLLPEICHCVEHFSYEGLRKFPIMQFLQGKLTYSQSKQLAELAPERLQVPSGIKVKLVYAPGSPPILRVQLQNLFGLADTPRIAQGQVAVLLHLLAPNGRPVQVTDDLRNFWNETYPQVRKELRGRYAKHSWPEDPWNAQALSRPKRRKE